MDMNNPIKDRLKTDEFAERLELMKSELYFPEIKPPKNIGEIINYVSDGKNLRSISPVELAEFSVSLAAYNISLTMQENRCHSYINWCEENIKFIIGKKLSEIDGYFAEKDLYIRANETNCVDLGKIKLEAQVKLDSIKFIAQKIEYLIQTLKTLVWEKRKERDV